MVKTPVLFLIFNRPGTTQKVFDEIRKAKPVRLYIAADGPRKNVVGERRKCEEARAVTKKIDWSCVVKRLYRKNNLGCKFAVSSAIDWFFDNVKEGIILEDDCVPSPSFFQFCEDMLKRYKNNTRIFHIGGDNFQPHSKQFANSYYFSKYSHVWGWASWRRAWKHYDVNMKSWPVVKKNGDLKKYWTSFWEKQYWKTIFDATYSGKIDTWDYQWLYTNWVNDALSIVPGVNLVKNIGFDNNATHMTIRSKSLELETERLTFPLKPPKEFANKSGFDNYTTKTNFHAEPLTVMALKVKYFLEKLS
jgi:hypothetical protein